MKLSLTGSIATIAEFFEAGLASILFQRGLYPPEDWTAVRSRYGLMLQTPADPDLAAYLAQITSQLENWVVASKVIIPAINAQVCCLVLVFTDTETGEPIERWHFDLNVVAAAGSDKENASSSAATSTISSSSKSAPPQPKEEKDIKTVHKEIAALLKQITASCSFLPLIEPSTTTFNVLAYTDKDAKVPLDNTWVDSDAKMVENAQQVQLRSFSTNHHKVDSVVAYRIAND